MASIGTGNRGIALVAGGQSVVPAVIEDAGESARRRFLEFFAASIRNPNTRAAYAQACGQFFAVIEASALTLHQVQPVHVAAYIEQLGQRVSAPTVKQHLAAIRRLFDFLVIGQVLPTNPAASVRGPRHVVTEGKTPILEAEEVRTLFAQFDEARLIDLRDRAILGAMVYSFARVGAVAKLRVKDYYRQGARAWFVLDEKGGKQNRVPAHHQAAEYVEQYLAKAGIEVQRETALFRSLGRGRGSQAVTERGLRREEIFAMVRRRTAAVGLPPEIGCHSFRGTGITNYLKNGGTIETAAKLAGHASTRTTQLYDRRLAEVAQAEVERIRF
jgi:site-specific recombinase XerD